MSSRIENLRQAFIDLLNSDNFCINLLPLFEEFADSLPSKGGLEMLEIVSNFRDSGDTLLTAYSTNCGSDVCSNRKYSKYFTLVGNNSKNYTSVQLVSLPNEEVRIRFCHAILPTPGIELNERIEIWRDPDALPF